MSHAAGHERGCEIGGPHGFATTHGSDALAAKQGDSSEAAAALEKLCRTYWYPLHAFRGVRVLVRMTRKI